MQLELGCAIDAKRHFTLKGTGRQLAVASVGFYIENKMRGKCLMCAVWQLCVKLVIGWPLLHSGFTFYSYSNKVLKVVMVHISVILAVDLNLQERKKLVDCFPLDLDVDKFLSSLHYDE